MSIDNRKTIAICKYHLDTSAVEDLRGRRETFGESAVLGTDTLKRLKYSDTYDTYADNGTRQFEYS